MKSTLNSLLITAAGVVLSTAGAYGQTNISANVPFEFRTAAGVQPAGQYAVEPSGVAVKIVNQDTRKASLLGIRVPEGQYKNAQPKLVFQCGSESGCALTHVLMGDGREWKYKAPQLKASETERVAVVVLLESKQAE
jgi:hypothetical protein